MRHEGFWEIVGIFLLASAWVGCGRCVCISIDTVLDFIFNQPSIEALNIPLHPNGTGCWQRMGS